MGTCLSKEVADQNLLDLASIFAHVWVSKSLYFPIIYFADLFLGRAKEPRSPVTDFLKLTGTSKILPKFLSKFIFFIFDK